MIINWPDETLKALIASRVFGLRVAYGQFGEWQIINLVGETFRTKDLTIEGEGRVVMCWSVKPVSPATARLWYPVPDYPNDIAAAWQVVDWMIEKGWEVNIEGDGVHSWFVYVSDPSWTHNAQDGPSNRCLASIYQNTAPLAICTAALVALEKPRNPW